MILQARSLIHLRSTRRRHRNFVLIFSSFFVFSSSTDCSIQRLIKHHLESLNDSILGKGNCKPTPCFAENDLTLFLSHKETHCFIIFISSIVCLCVCLCPCVSMSCGTVIESSFPGDSRMRPRYKREVEWKKKRETASTLSRCPRYWVKNDVQFSGLHLEGTAVFHPVKGVTSNRNRNKNKTRWGVRRTEKRLALARAKAKRLCPTVARAGNRG